MTPEVSVIIPAYNAEAYIARALDSVLNQTFENLEVIVVDDGSTDNTVEVVKKINDGRIKLLINSTNLGAGASRNLALSLAKGTWVAVLDSDDWYALDRLEKLLKTAYDYHADMVADDLYLVKDGESSPWGSLMGQSGECFEHVRQITPAHFVHTDIEGKKGLSLGFSKPLFRREFLQLYGVKYDESIKVAEDFWFDLECLVHGARFFFLPRPYYFYVSRDNSLSNTPKLERLSQERHKVLDFLTQDFGLDSDLNLVSALHMRLNAITQHLEYYQVVEPLKSKQWDRALVMLSKYPYFFIHLIKQFPKIFSRRFQCLVLRNKMAYERMY
jgi:succinoglycan biosynthesis protein ExoO